MTKRTEKNQTMSTIDTLKRKLMKTRNFKYDLEMLEQHFMTGGVIEESDLVSLLTSVKDILSKEKNVIEINSPCSIYGDYHGFYFDLIAQQKENKEDKQNHKAVKTGEEVYFLSALPPRPRPRKGHR